MAAHYESKHGLVPRTPAEMYMGFVDMRNFTMMLPAEYKDKVTADYDTLSVEVQGFRISVRVVAREPYSLLRFSTVESPIAFEAALHFETADGGRTDFSIELEADLNLMMKAMLGGRIKEALDKVVDGMVDPSSVR